MVISTTLSSSPTMVYFGQEVGEAGNEDAGFGKRSRTSIFDYVGVPNHQRWMNNGKFDGGQLSKSEKELRDFYKRLLNFTIKSEALMGKFQEIQSVNRQDSSTYGQNVYSFVRWSANEKLIIVSNLSPNTNEMFDLKIPADVIKEWKLKDGTYLLTEQLYGVANTLKVTNGVGIVKISLKGSESFILKL
jgi:glycosidase